MKRREKWSLLGGLLLATAVVFTACSANHGTTPIAPTVISYSGSFSFNPASVTIRAGMTVLWDNSFGCSHTLNIDNGAGACVTNYTCYPVTITFPNTGTYSFHCNYHSGCGPSSCTSCTGMAGTVVVQ